VYAAAPKLDAHRVSLSQHRGRLYYIMVCFPLIYVFVTQLTIQSLVERYYGTRFDVYRINISFRIRTNTRRTLQMMTTCMPHIYYKYIHIYIYLYFINLIDHYKNNFYLIYLGILPPLYICIQPRRVHSYTHIIGRYYMKRFARISSRVAYYNISSMIFYSN